MGDTNGHLYARDALTGDALWQFKAGGPIMASPVIVGQRVYFGALDGVLYALDRAHGAVLWKLGLDVPIYASPVFGSGHLYIPDPRRAAPFDRVTLSIAFYITRSPLALEISTEEPVESTRPAISAVAAHTTPSRPPSTGAPASLLTPGPDGVLGEYQGLIFGGGGRPLSQKCGSSMTCESTEISGASPSASVACPPCLSRKLIREPNTAVR